MGQTFYGQISGQIPPQAEASQTEVSRVEASRFEVSRAAHSVFRPMEEKDVCLAGEIASAGRAFLKEQGVSQWQKGSYPCADNYRSDVGCGIGFVLELDGQVAAVCAVTDTPELSYAEIDGSWLTSGTASGTASGTKYFTVHRSAVSPDFRGRGVFGLLIDAICEKAVTEGVPSIRIDTHEFNKPMCRALEKSGFTLCGRLILKEGAEAGDPRLAYEKLLLRR